MTQTIGQRLKAEREEQRLTLEKVFEATRIRIQYLEALEADDLSVMPSPVQARGYLRNYAEYLGFDVEKVLHQLRESDAQPASEEVIGPADPPSIPLQQEDKGGVVRPQAFSPQSFDNLAGGAVVEELTVPVKPKLARRKKADAESIPAATEPPTRRHTRKKVESEVVAVEQAQPDWQNRVEDKFAAPKSTPPLERGEVIAPAVEAN